MSNEGTIRGIVQHQKTDESSGGEPGLRVADVMDDEREEKGMGDGPRRPAPRKERDDKAEP